ncbi:hypothetical protein FACS1894217_07950 [Clostridia bacterium]|nr:hypothetical protein FACS1894217_07950 [Clostridia bacterium]
MHKNWMTGVVVFLAVALVGSGIAALAVGTATNPLVSESYVNNEFKPQIMDKINTAVVAATKSYNDSITAQFGQFQADVEKRLNSFGAGTVDTAALLADQAFIDAVASAVAAKITTGGGQTSGAGAGWTYVEVAAGKTVELNRGTEVILRVGTAKCVASSAVGLVDITTAETIENNNALKINHNYLCTIEGRGVKADAALKIFIRGGYVIK